MKKLSITLLLMSIIMIFSLVSCLPDNPPADPCAEGHTWGDYTVITEASCTAAGKQSRVCSVCGEAEEVELPMLDHTPGTELKYDESNHWNECSACESKSNVAAHSLGDWVVVTEPTYTEKGLKKQSCECGYYVEQEIDTLVPVTGIELNKSSATLILNGSTEASMVELVATVLPENAENKNYIWESTNEEVAVVVDGKVYAMGLGTCEIKAISEQGEHSASCQITVINEPESVSLSGGGSVTLNGTLNLTATVLPADAADKTVVWTSSNESILKVEGGVVTAVGAGKATITVTTSNGKTASVEISVIEANIDANLSDSIYNGINPYYWALENYKDAEGKTHNVAQNIKIYFGEDGLYFAIEVDDASAQGYDNARLETFLMLGDTPTTTTTYQIRFYMNSEQYTYRFYSFGGDTTKWSWNEKTTTSSIIYSKSVNEAGYTVEAFVPYAELGLSAKPETVNYMSVLAHIPEEGGQLMSYGTYDNLFVKYASLQEYKVDKYIQYNANGVVYKQITVDGDFNLDATNIAANGNYEATFTIDYLYGITPATGVAFTGTGAEYISEVGNGVYKISVPAANIGDFAEAKTIKAAIAGLEKEFSVTIVAEVLPSSVVISGGTDAILKVGQTVNLVATVSPEDAFNTNVIWTSSDPTVATVVNGVVTALKEGAATITAISERDATVYDTYTIAVLTPDVEMNFENSDNRLENTGSDSSISASANKLNSEKNSTSFVGYDYNISTGANGTGSSIGINHNTGAYPVMNKDLGAGDFSISFNFNINAQNTGSGSGKYLFGTVQPDGTNGISVVLRNNTIRFRNDNETKFLTVTLPADDTTWHNITLTRNGTALTMYYDGAAVGSFTIAADKSYGKIAFGAYYGQGNWGYMNQTFFLDDLMFFDKALTADEISGKKFAELAPTVKMTFDNAANRLENTGSDSTITAASKVLNSVTSSTSFVDLTLKVTTGADGVGSALEVNHNKGAYPVMSEALGSGDFTISFNFNINGQNTSSGSGKYLFGTVQPDGTDGFSVVLRNNVIRFRYDNTSDFPAINLPADDTAWHNITLTRKGTTLTLYYDGAVVKSYTIAADKSYGAVAFGAYYGQGNWGYMNQTFFLDDVMFFNRALTSEEILAVAKRYE